MVKILVTGGSGFVGTELVKALSKSGNFSVTVLDADIGKKIPGVRYLSGDITHYEDVRRAVKGQDCVYHLAAVLDEGCPKKKLFDVNLGGTICVLESCREEKVKKLVYLSTDGVMAERKEVADEKTPYGPRTNYQKSKASAERTVLDYHRRHGIPVVVIRAALIYGPNRYWLSILKKAEESFPVIGSGKNMWHAIYIKNLIPALLKARIAGKDGEVYLVADEEALTYGEMYRIIREELEVKKRPAHVPVLLAKLAALFSPRGSLVSVHHINRLVKNKKYDISKAVKYLNYRPAYGFKNGIRETIKCLRDQGLLER